MDTMTPANQSSHHNKEVQKFWDVYDKTREKIAMETLSTHWLDRCKFFVNLVNDNKAFAEEVSKLSHDALLFCSMAFTERSFKRIGEEFDASTMHHYIHERKISCEKHKKRIENRLMLYSNEEDKFRELYKKATSTSLAQLPRPKYTFVGARKEVMGKVFTESIMKEFEKVPHWGEFSRTPTTRMDLYGEEAKVVIDAPPHVDISAELSDLFKNPAFCSDLTITTQVIKQVVIGMPAKEGARLAKTMFPQWRQ